MAEKQFLNMSRLAQMRMDLLTQAEVTPELLAYQRQLKIDHATVSAYAGLLAVCLCKFFGSNDGDERFEFDPHGTPSAVIEALLYDKQREEYIADLVAWPLHAPCEFATALGVNGGADILGVVHMVQRQGRPLRVFQTPHEWLAAGCLGCTPLSVCGGRHWLLKAGGPFTVGSVEEGRWLRDMLGPRANSQRILVPPSSKKEAA